MFSLKGTMRNLLNCFVLAVGLTAILASCSGDSESKVYHWASKGDVGPKRFVVDHNLCMREADGWPFETSAGEMLDFISPGPHDPKHLLGAKDDMVWASFIPYKGAQAVYVNDVNSSSMIDGNDYATCMEKKGYVQGYPEETRNHLINDRQMGYRGDYF